MAWQYRKRIQIIPGVRLNLSRSGISTSVGIRGANLTIGKNGTYLNTGLPGTGIYQRQKLSGSFKSEDVNPSFSFIPSQIEDLDSEIVSQDVQEITSQDMQGVKDSIIMALEQHKELSNDLAKIKTSLASKKTFLILSYIFLYGLLFKKIQLNLKTEIASQQEVIIQLKEQIDSCHVNLIIDFDKDFLEKYNQLKTSFTTLCSSHKIWDITSEQFQDRALTRSSAGKLVKKKEVKFKTAALPFINCDFDALFMKNANGADFFIYPTFVVMYSSNQKFAIIGMDELEFHHSSVRFTETGPVPQDSKIIDYTWAKVNKNGSRDKRFKGNYQIPVVKYGEFSLSTLTGVNEEYEISNYEYSQDFSRAFREYQSIVNLYSPSIKGIN